MIHALFGLAAGIGMPMQTSINTQLGRRVGSPLVSSMISFIVGVSMLTLITAIVQHGIHIPFGNIQASPPWILLGGFFAVIFVTGNIMMMPRLGSVQTVILPALGQILMGTLIDTFGWFDSPQRDMDVFRILGVMLVFGGVLLVILTKAENATAAEAASGEVAADGVPSAEAPARGIWLWRGFGIAVGMCMATQTAVNAHLAVVVESRLYAALISFSIGMILLFILNILLWKTKKPGDKSGGTPFWIWCGGLFGDLYLVGNIVTGLAVGTGMAVVILLIGLMIGGLLVDRFGLFRSARRPITWKEILGVAIMVVGAALFHLA